MKSNYTETDEFVLFWNGPYSNWWPVKFHMITEYGKKYFNCAEQAMMYHKAMLFNDVEIAKEIMKSDSPKEQKALGRKVKNFNANKWDNSCIEIVTRILIAKFSSNDEMIKLILDTGEKTLVEASPVDKIWGIGLSEDDPRATEPDLWKGKNYLGICLMRAREIIKERYSPC